MQPSNAKLLPPGHSSRQQRQQQQGMAAVANSQLGHVSHTADSRHDFQEPDTDPSSPTGANESAWHGHDATGTRTYLPLQSDGMHQSGMNHHSLASSAMAAQAASSKVPGPIALPNSAVPGRSAPQTAVLATPANEVADVLADREVQELIAVLTAASPGTPIEELLGPELVTLLGLSGGQPNSTSNRPGYVSPYGNVINGMLARPGPPSTAASVHTRPDVQSSGQPGHKASASNARSPCGFGTMMQPSTLVNMRPDSAAMPSSSHSLHTQVSQRPTKAATSYASLHLTPDQAAAARVAARSNLAEWHMEGGLMYQPGMGNPQAVASNNHHQYTQPYQFRQRPDSAGAKMMGHNMTRAAWEAGLRGGPGSHEPWHHQHPSRQGQRQDEEDDNRGARLYERSVGWRKRCDQRYQMLRKELKSHELDGCTFAPKIDRTSQELVKVRR